MQIENIQIDQMSVNVKSDDDRASIKKLPTQREIQNWIVNYIAELLEIKPDSIDVTISFDCFGLDSSAAVELSGDLEDWLGRELEPTILYDYPTVEALAKHLSEECQAYTLNG